MNAFTAPAEGGGGWNPSESSGHLLILEPDTLEKGIPTSFGDKEASRGTVHDVDAQETFEDTLIFPRVLIGSLKQRLGERVLARLSTGTAKPGQKPPWTLDDASADTAAVAKATAYLNSYLSEGMTSPPAAAAEPAAAAPVAAGGDADALAAAMEVLKANGITAS